MLRSEVSQPVRYRSSIICYAFLSLFFALNLTASTIELEATGTITVSDFASVPVGTQVTAYLFYDPDAAPYASYATSAGYEPPQGVIFDFGGSSLIGGTSTGIVTILDNNSPSLDGVAGGDDAVVWLTTSPTATGPIASDPAFDSTGITSLGINFEAPHADGILPSTSLPSTFPTLPGQWTDGSFYFLPITGSNPPYGSFSGVFDSVTEVPEPDLSGLYLGGVAALFLARRKSRQ